ncbi:MAG: hypothetical protein IJC17_07625 [Clostridia bacterium]|nr:hypothetical protein [Clostridia bacterium]
MKTVIALLCLLLLLVQVGCVAVPAPIPSAYQPTEVENVGIRITNVSPTGATVYIQDDNPDPYVYGEWYAIERETDGAWFAVDTVIDDYGFNDLGYMPNPNGELKFSTDWKWLYGELPTGHYRLLKQVNRQYLSVEFDIA